MPVSSWNGTPLKWDKLVNRKPDVVLLVAATFAVGLLLTLLLPLAANRSVANPASELQAGVIFAE